MGRFFAIHRSALNGLFKGEYYYTQKNNAMVGDELYVISSSSLRNPNYYLEGLFTISSITADRGRNRLNLMPLHVRSPIPSISEQTWYVRKEFRNQFASGQSLNVVPPEFDERFERLLTGDAAKIFADEDALDDLGTDCPDRASVPSVRFKRDRRVRAAVLSRANGNCEYCGRSGFISADGSKYLETHHIIALANEGADRISNVIALCAEDHRIAHYGKDSSVIEREMIAIISKLI